MGILDAPVPGDTPGGTTGLVAPLHGGGSAICELRRPCH